MTSPRCVTCALIAAALSAALRLAAHAASGESEAAGHAGVVKISAEQAAQSGVTVATAGPGRRIDGTPRGSAAERGPRCACDPARARRGCAGWEKP